jgi:tyrosyl-tRNA synthetase
VGNLKIGLLMVFRPKSDFLNIMISRGFIADCTDYAGLDHLLSTEICPGYIGFDATAKSLHVGSLMQIMMLRWLQKTGGKPITLMGGGTTKIGDPSFRADERPLLNDKQIEENISGIKGIFSNFLNFGEKPSDALMINNAEWLDELNYIQFLREIGGHFSVNRMLSFESVKSRLDREQSLSFLEFNYMILQAYDFYELNQRYGCKLQMGGSDQMGNIINGMELSRRKANAKVFGLTSPLLTTSDGKKMGKSQNGAVWLNKEMLSPFDFWQFWRNTSDADVGKFLKLYTEIDLAECEKLGALKGAEINEAKSILANHVTTLCHGEKVASDVEKTAKDVFEQGGAGSDLPSYRVTMGEVETGLSVAQLLIKTGLTKSGKEAKRLISENGARLNGVLVTDISQTVNILDFNKPLKLSAGKKRHAIIDLQK